jgi:replication-associated recombination protein RarA
MSLLQKSIRRGDRRLAGYAVCEMHPIYYKACWRRLLTIGAEDVADWVHTELMALYNASEAVNAGKKANDVDCALFLLKSAFLLCDAVKSRDTDNFVHCQYGNFKISDKEVRQAIAELEESERIKEFPDYVYDKHTMRGKSRGETKTAFIFREDAALEPKSPRTFFDPVEGEIYD